MSRTRQAHWSHIRVTDPFRRSILTRRGPQRAQLVLSIRLSRRIHPTYSGGEFRRRDSGRCRRRRCRGRSGAARVGRRHRARVRLAAVSPDTVSGLAAPLCDRGTPPFARRTGRRVTGDRAAVVRRDAEGHLELPVRDLGRGDSRRQSRRTDDDRCRRRPKRARLPGRWSQPPHTCMSWSSSGPTRRADSADPLCDPATPPSLEVHVAV